MLTISLNEVGRNYIPAERTNPKPLIKLFFKSLTGKWQYGYEIGKGGYKHVQARIEFGYDGSKEEFIELQERCKMYFGYIPHIERAKTTSWEYEKKDSHYITSEDTTERHKCRFCVLREWQERVLRDIETQSVRQVDVYINKSGNIGKTHFVHYLWERGIGLLIPRHKRDIDRVTETIVSKYKGEKVVIFDLGRNRTLGKQDVETIEIVKDGIIENTRFHSNEINIRGIKIIVFTNNYIEKEVYTKLSQDRWRIHYIDENGTRVEKRAK